MGAFQIYISRRIFPMNPGIMAFQSVLTELSNEHLKLNMLQNKFLVFLSNPLLTPSFPHLSKWQHHSSTCWGQKTLELALTPPFLSHSTYTPSANPVGFTINMYLATFCHLHCHSLVQPIFFSHLWHLSSLLVGLPAKCLGVWDPAINYKDRPTQRGCIC